MFSILSSFKLGTFAQMASKKEDFRTKMQLLKVSCSSVRGKTLDLVWGPNTHKSNVSFLTFEHRCARPVRRYVGTNSVDLKNRSFLGLRFLSNWTLPSTARWSVWWPRNGRLSWCILGPTIELPHNAVLLRTCRNDHVNLVLQYYLYLNQLWSVQSFSRAENIRDRAVRENAMKELQRKRSQTSRLHFQFYSSL